MANTFGDAMLDMLKTHPFTSVTVVVGAQNGYGFEFQKAGGLRGFVGEEQAVIEETSVLVKSGDFTGLQADVSTTVDGTSYVIRRVEDVDDGHVIRLVLAEA